VRSQLGYLQPGALWELHQGLLLLEPHWPKLCVACSTAPTGLGSSGSVSGGSSSSSLAGGSSTPTGSSILGGVDGSSTDSGRDASAGTSIISRILGSASSSSSSGGGGMQQAAAGTEPAACDASEQQASSGRSVREGSPVGAPAEAAPDSWEAVREMAQLALKPRPQWAPASGGFGATAAVAAPGARKRPQLSGQVPAWQLVTRTLQDISVSLAALPPQALPLAAAPMWNHPEAGTLPPLPPHLYQQWLHRPQWEQQGGGYVDGWQPEPAAMHQEPQGHLPAAALQPAELGAVTGKGVPAAFYSRRLSHYQVRCCLLVTAAWQLGRLLPCLALPCDDTPCPTAEGAALPLHPPRMLCRLPGAGAAAHLQPP